MKENKTINIQFGGFYSLLTVLFIALKLSGHINWSWWWVLGPLWIPFTVALAIFLGLIIFLVVIYLISALLELKK